MIWVRCTFCFLVSLKFHKVWLWLSHLRVKSDFRIKKPDIKHKSIKAEAFMMFKFQLVPRNLPRFDLKNVWRWIIWMSMTNGTAFSSHWLIYHSEHGNKSRVSSCLVNLRFGDNLAYRESEEKLFSWYVCAKLMDAIEETEGTKTKSVITHHL